MDIFFLKKVIGKILVREILFRFPKLGAKSPPVSLRQTVRFSHLINVHFGRLPPAISRLNSLSPKLLLLFNFPYFDVNHLTLLSSNDNTLLFLQFLQIIINFIK